MGLAQITLVDEEITVDISGVSLLAPLVAAATASAALSEKWANEAEDVVVSGGEYSAKHYVAKAAVEKVAAQSAASDAAAAVAPVLGIVDSLSTLETLGRPVASPPVTGTALATNTYVIATPVTNAGVIETVRAWGLASGTTLKLRVFDKSGDDFTQSGSDVNVVLTAGAGLKTVTVALAVAAGQYIGYYVPANSIARNAATADNGGVYNPAVAADSTSFTDATPTTTLRHEIGFDIAYQFVTAERQIETDGAVETLEASAASVALRLPVVEETNVVQILGKQGTPAAGSNASHSTYVLSDPAIGDGRITSVEVWSGAAPGTAQIKIFNTADGMHTQAGSDIPWVLTANSLNTYPTSIPILKGQRFGIYSPTTASIHRDTASAYFSGGYDSASATNASSVAQGSTPETNDQALQLRVTMEVSRPDKRQLRVADSDRVVVLGDSFSQSSQTHRGKSWIGKVSLFSDLTFDNFGVAGDTVAQVMTRLRAGTQTLGPLAYRDRGAAYALIYIGQNDAGSISIADFLIDLHQLIETVKGLGAIPILVAPHSLDGPGGGGMWGQGFSLIYRNLAEEHGCYFVDVAENARLQDYGARYGGFWNGTHPGVRTNQIIAGPIANLIDQLPVQQSIKVFRKRSGVSVATVADLIFNDHYQRAKLFKEILVGTGALITTTGEAIYDELNLYDGPTHSELLSSEYQALQIGDTIALDDYSLIDVVLPTTAKNIDQLTLTLSETGATVYARGGMLTATVTDGTPLGSWTVLNGTGGVYRLSNSELRRFMRQDKISLLVYKSGGIAAFGQPVIEWVGTPIAKPAKVTKTRGRRALGVEKLTSTSFSDAAGWTVTGTVVTGGTELERYGPADGCLPAGSTGRVTVDSANYVSQAVTFTADNERSREIEITVNARRFVPIDDGSITADSFDGAMLQIEVGATAGRVPYREKVGLWWESITFRTIAPLGTTGLTLYIRGASGSPAIEVAKASFKFVDA